MQVHHHLIVRAQINNNRTVEEVNDWLEHLITVIGMNILHGPVSLYCDKTGNAGITSFAIIDTSHIVLHTWDEKSPSMLQLDVYSCAEFKVEDVIWALGFFEPVHIDYKFLDMTENFIKIQAP